MLHATSSSRTRVAGSPISPLLANVYMRRFVLAWKKLGLQRTLGSRIVTYADDLVILCKRGKAEEALLQLRAIMGKLKLTVNEEKTQICKVPEGEFDFLGYTFGRMYSATTGQARMGMRPSKKSIRRMVEKVHALPEVERAWSPDEMEVSVRRSPTLANGIRVPSSHAVTQRQGNRIASWQSIRACPAHRYPQL
ncbi:reverse transcriptase domain-containing protein [Paraburkholderia sp. UCT31]|uniref:reverse transcriptase domain-containing protein n=1 Tax=Paraburkholderia sp. UCT31 TaxID=2615209 RepID=UPI00223C3DE5|nr:reverse transcriptase domain-containing protein [Paraburkholderia sp. UCT31]